MALNIRLYHLKKIAKRKKEELENEQGRNRDLVESDRTGDDRQGQVETGGRIQENLETLSIERSEHSMELMTLRQISEATGATYKVIRNYAYHHNIEPKTKKRFDWSLKPVGLYDPQPFFERYAQMPYEKPTIEEVIQDETGDETQEAAAGDPPAYTPENIRLVTPKLIRALRHLFSAREVASILVNNYGLNPRV